MTKIADNEITDEEFATARVSFSEKELADLSIAIGLINAFNRLGIAFGIEPAATRIQARTSAASQ